ncbi:MAG TPA: PQQ-binding-like beta-propeller repeat protein [Anaeromyxobacteraceae bacterium]|nr:PQQ-binding-like beta-propeller repeat protein [Anaeromyxobacteraceae bacterium]
MVSSLAAVLLAAAAPPAPPAASNLYRVLWTRQLTPQTLLEYKPSEPGGAGVDPATGMVVVGTRDGWVHAFLPDGALIWEFRAAGGFLAPPLVGSDAVFVGSLDGRVYARDKATGKERWQYDVKEEIGSRPVAWGGLVYVATLQDTVLALDARTGAFKWHHRRESTASFTIRGVATPVADGGVLYAGFSDGAVVALDAATGVLRWERRVAPRGDFMDVDGIALDEGRLYAAAYSGAVVALEPATGKPLWEVKAPQACRVAAGKGYVGVVTVDQVLFMTGQDGKELWRLPLQGMPTGLPVALGRGLGLLLVPNGHGLLLIDARGGRILRNFNRGEGASSSPVVADRRVYVLSNAGELVAVELLK